MKKILFLAVMALMGVSANAQYKTFDSKAVSASKVQVTNRGEKLSTPMQVAGTFNAGEITRDRLDRKVSIDATKLVPATERQHRAKAAMPALPTQGKALGKSIAKNRHMTNIQPTVNLGAQAAAPRKAAALAENYFAMGLNYRTRDVEEWTMTPGTGTITDEETGVETQVDVLVDVIPTPSYFSEIFPNGIPVQYTVEDNVITINPQALFSYKNEAGDTTFYVSLFSVTSDDEDGVINMEVGENGKLTVTNGNWICFGEFANVEFDPDLGDSEAYLGFDELYANVTYFYKMGLSIDKEFNAYGIDAETNETVNWTMKQGKYFYDDEETPVFIDMCPFLEEFSSIFPDGVNVEYKQSGNIITVTPQLLASYTTESGTQVYLILHSNASEDGNIVLTVGEDGSLTTINNEIVTIGAWSTDEFNADYETYLGYYASTSRVHYLLPGAAPLAPEDVACEPANTVLFAGQALSGYYYGNYNLGMIGAYAPTSFTNLTKDPASGFNWSVKEYGEEENVLTSTDRDFSINTIGGYAYGELLLKGNNQGSESEVFNFGCMGVDDAGELLCDTLELYAGQSAYAFQFSDGSYATMTTKSCDDDMIFYTNWGTPDKTSTSMSRIYSYQGKPATPLFINGVTLPLVSFTSQDDFNLHLIIYKCTRNANGSVTLGDIIAEADATSENINADYSDRNIWAIEFTDLYVEDEFGLSESLDYLFIEDEFLVCFDGWDNGTFSGVIGSDDNMSGRGITTWFEMTGEEGHLYRYTQWKPQLFIGLLGATYGYLYTEDNTDLQFDGQGGEASIHIEPMYYGWDEEDENLPVPSLYLESITVDGEEVEEIPEWITVNIANLDQTIDAEGYPNSIDYDLVFQVAASDGNESRSAEIVYMQRGARLKVTISQGNAQGGIKGDVNSDGTIDVADISAVISQMAGTASYEWADVNGDGSVDVADISKIISIMAQ